MKCCSVDSFMKLSEADLLQGFFLSNTSEMCEVVRKLLLIMFNI